MSTAVIWFRRDLRVHDHPALDLALREYDRVLPVFVLDPTLLDGSYASGPRTRFMIGCLDELDGTLRALGSGLILLSGEPEQELLQLVIETDTDAVLWTSDVSPYARRRDQRVTEALRASGVEARPQPGNYIGEIARLKTDSGNPYRVFSPFHRRWLNSPRREVLDPPQEMPALPAEVHKLAFQAQIDKVRPHLSPELEAPLVQPGEKAARQALTGWLESGIHDYDERHDRVDDLDSCSTLSPYLRWGCLSPLEAEAAALATGGSGASAWTRQLCWRDFYAHVLLHWPENLKREFQPSLRELEWDYDEDRLTAWQSGMTGYPIVDAGMRQLAATGWMHNRARLIVGSFLTKDLQLDWREGERWFSRLLLDGEPTQNNGNWQWIASVGTDPAPLTRRLYNPVLQSERHDPEGRYIRRWVPELAAVPNQYIHQPWTMPEAIQNQSGCRIGGQYPKPIVDHAVERKIAIERYGLARELSSNHNPKGDSDA